MLSWSSGLRVAIDRRRCPIHELSLHMRRVVHCRARSPGTLVWFTAVSAFTGCDGHGEAVGEAPGEPVFGAVQMDVPIVHGSSGSEATVGRVVAVAVDEAGRAWAADSQARHVLVLDPDGSVVDTLGRRGDGPGEFSSISWIGLTGVGDLWAKDPVARRLTRFAAADGAVETVSFPQDGFNTSIPWAASIEGDSLLFVRTTENAPGSSTTTTTVSQYALDPSEVRLLHAVELPPIARPDFVESTAGQIQMRSTPPLAPIEDVVWSGAGGWRVRSSEFQVERLAAGGQVVDTIEADVVGVPTGARVRDSLAARYALPREAIPEAVPPIVSLDLDRAGNVWVGRTMDGNTLVGWEVFGAGGDHLASVSLPPGITLLPSVLSWSGGFLAAVSPGPLGEHRVVVFRIPDALRSG